MSAEIKTVPIYGLTYIRNPAVGGIAFYFQFELEAGHEYEVQVTRDAMNYSPIHSISTEDKAAEIYFTYNVSTSAGPWPRVVMVK